MSSLKLTEIFYSLQGESSRVGWPTIFVRLTGCPLRCQYCDTDYAFYGGTRWSLDDIVRELQRYQTRYVTITGGEPLAQPAVHDLMRQLCDLDYRVSIETAGALAIEMIDPRVMIVMDLKTPGSGECEKNRFENLAYLKSSDQIKFVICNREDYKWAKDLVKDKSLDQIGTVLFSPSHQELSPTELADWMLADQLPVRFQMQLHKLLWGDVKGK